MPPFVALYHAILTQVSAIVPTYSPSQDIPKQLPVCRVSPLNGDPNEYVKNTRRYSYTFQLDVVTDKNSLEHGLVLAYQVMNKLRQITVKNCSVQLGTEPSLSSMVDTSTNRVLNRQIIRVNYNIIEDTAL